MNKSPSKLDPVFKLAKKQVNTLLKAFPAAPSSPEILSVELAHEMRVTTKKLRALLQLYRPCCTKIDIEFVNQTIKQLADSYSDQRDTDIQYEMVCRATKELNQEQGNDLQPLQRYFSKVKQQAMAKSVAMDVQVGFEHILQTWKENLKPKSVPNFEQGVNLTYRKSRELAHTAKLTDEDDTYHHCRKWVKYYLYQLRMLVAEKRVKEDDHIEQLTVLGDMLGKLHDNCVLEQTLRDLLADTKKKDTSKVRGSDAEGAILRMLTWLAEQKRLDKTQCHQLFKSVFSHKNNPITV